MLKLFRMKPSDFFDILLAWDLSPHQDSSWRSLIYSSDFNRLLTIVYDLFTRKANQNKTNFQYQEANNVFNQK